MKFLCSGIEFICNIFSAVISDWSSSVAVVLMVIHLMSVSDCVKCE